MLSEKNLILYWICDILPAKLINLVNFVIFVIQNHFVGNKIQQRQRVCMNISENITELIVNTPLVKINRLNGNGNPEDSPVLSGGEPGRIKFWVRAPGLFLKY